MTRPHFSITLSAVSLVLCAMTLTVPTVSSGAAARCGRISSVQQQVSTSSPSRETGVDTCVVDDGSAVVFEVLGSTSGGGGDGSQGNGSTTAEQTSNSNSSGEQSGSGWQITTSDRAQNATQNQATTLTAEQIAYAQEQQRIQAEQKLWTRTLNDIEFDQSWGVIGRLSNDPNYTANRMLYDLNQDLPDLYALARAHWAQLDATPPAAEPVSNINPGGPPQIVLDTIWNWTHQTTVATPNPHVQAGKAIPGLLTYLETGMNLHLNETITSPAGPLHITGTATLTINWGDGETQTGITTPGAPYPDGQLTHHYPNSGNYDITVTANWTIHYNLAGTIGVIPLQTTGTLPAFPVRTLRAVARQITE